MSLKSLEFVVPNGPVLEFKVVSGLVVPVGTVVTGGLQAVASVPSSEASTKDLKALLGIRKRKAVAEEEDHVEAPVAKDAPDEDDSAESSDDDDYDEESEKADTSDDE